VLALAFGALAKFGEFGGHCFGLVEGVGGGGEILEGLGAAGGVAVGGGVREVGVGDGEVFACVGQIFGDAPGLIFEAMSELFGVAEDFLSGADEGGPFWIGGLSRWSRHRRGQNCGRPGILTSVGKKMLDYSGRRRQPVRRWRRASEYRAGPSGRKNWPGCGS
jgi:hypothetical protein